MAYSEGFFSGLFLFANLEQRILILVHCKAFLMYKAGRKKANLVH